MPAYLHASFVRVDVNVGFDLRDLRLRQILVLSILLLVVREAVIRHIGGDIAIEDDGVVVDPDAQSGEGRQGRREYHARRRAKARASDTRALFPALCDAPRP